MADVKFSGVGVTDIMGPVGSRTFSRNLYGAYVKTRIGAPTPTAFLTAWQTQFGITADYWRDSMSEAERTAWYSAAISHPDNFGDRNAITGYYYFMSTNLNSFLVGGGTITAPPPVAVFQQCKAIEILTLTPAVFTFRTPDISGSNFLLYATPNLSPGRMSYKQIFGFVAATGTTVTSMDIYTPYVARFGVPVAGKKIFIRLVEVSAVSYQRAMPVITSAIVQP